MLKLMTSLLNDIRKNRGKTFLTLFTVALGVGILALSLSLSGWLSRMVNEKLEKEGIILNYANASWSAAGELEKTMPPQLTREVVTVLRQELPSMTAAAPLFQSLWSEISVGTKRMQIRNVMGSTEEYAAVMGLNLLEGSFFSARDVETGARKAVISQSLAVQLFGSPEQALGQTFQPPPTRFRRMGGEESVTVETFTITGVFEDPDEFLRSSYRIADLVVPVTSVLPGGANISRMLDMAYGSGVLRIQGIGAGQAEALIRQILAGEYGEDIDLAIWEGSPEGDTAAIASARETVATFSVTVNLLGIILLLTGAIGILSLMMIEALGRTREIALERALGASKGRILMEFTRRALLLTSFSVLLGLLLALVLIRPAAALLAPVFSGLGLAGLAPGLSLPGILIACLTALTAGGLLGAVPVLSLMRGSISEAVREG